MDDQQELFAARIKQWIRGCADDRKIGCRIDVEMVNLREVVATITYTGPAHEFIAQAWADLDFDLTGVANDYSLRARLVKLERGSDRTITAVFRPA